MDSGWNDEAEGYYHRPSLLTRITAKRLIYLCRRFIVAEA